MFDKKAYMREYRKKYVESHRKSSRLYAKRCAIKLRMEIISHYGGHCACCGEDQIDFLTIDHINNDGAKARREGIYKTGSRFYIWIKKSGFPEDLQVLCRNCNWSKFSNGGHCVHETMTMKLMKRTG